MNPSEEDRRFRPVLDSIVALAAASTPFLDLYFNELSETSGTPFSFATASMFAFVIGISLLVRRRFPLPVLVLLLLGAVMAAATGKEELPIPFTIAAAVALFTVASTLPRQTAVLAGVVSIAIAFPLELVSTRGSMISRESLAPVFWSAFAVAAGDAVRSRRIYVQVLEERARRAEETREQEARARVTEERLHIARELHDIVAHHIAVVNIQAGLAERAMSRNALETAATAVSHVSEAARLALDDLSAVLHLLRGTGDIDRRDPAPGLDQVNDLLDSYANADNRVRTTIRGKAQPLHAASELTAYRVIQEALTNATKHGILGETHLTLSYEPRDFVVHVSNPVRTDAEGNLPAPPGTGYGMIGLHERVDAIGGRVSAGPQANGIFVVEAHIPYAPAEPVRTEATS
ncbi:MAG: two-component sensor histidine kinase [Chloroflexia bacterium]|nr:two-component sensor histidine kinase [Chloroflexia bacterium]